jgi:signal transduction histidine kinase
MLTPQQTVLAVSRSEPDLAEGNARPQPAGNELSSSLPPTHNPGRLRLQTRAWEIAAIYAVAGLLWIYFSDQLLAFLAPDPQTLLIWSSYKGFAFIAVTAVLLLLLLTRTFRTIAAGYAALEATERLLRESNESLERRVRERTAELETACVRAEAADRIKSAFLATMSHELRTPLNSIIGFTGIVLQGLAGPLNTEQQKQLDMVRSSARHLLALVNDVLDLSRIEAGQLDIDCEPFDVLAALSRLVESIRPQAATKGLTVHVHLASDLGMMVGDERRFEQIVLNLLGNAVKFTDQGSLTLSAERCSDADQVDSSISGPVIRLRVSDTGPGIKPEYLSDLFQPFRQIDSGLARNHDGTGLGLAICRRLAGLMGGTIGVESQYGHGSTFTVTLPLKEPETCPKPESC